MRSTRWMLLALVPLVLAACTSASQSPAASEAASAPASAAESTGGESVGGEPSAAACGPGTVCNGPLVPGEYTSTSLGPTITFTVGADTSGGEDAAPLGFTLSLDTAGDINFMSVTPFGTGFTDPCTAEGSATVAGDPDSIVAYFSALTGLTAQAPISTTVGGRPATQVDVVNNGDCGEGARVNLWVIADAGIFSLRAGEQARIVAVDAGSVTVLIVTEAFPNADWEAVLAWADAILASMTITPAS